jgi:hypothetical protein
MEAENKRVRELESKFEKAYASAYRLACSKEDFLAARNTLEVAFSKFTDSLNSDILFKAKVLQVEVFASLGQNKQAKGAIREANEIQLTEHEKVQLYSFYERLKKLTNKLKQIKRYSRNLLKERRPALMQTFFTPDLSRKIYILKQSFLYHPQIVKVLPSHLLKDLQKQL